MREAVIARPRTLRWSWLLLAAVAACAMAAVWLGGSRSDEGRAAVQGNAAADSLGPHEVDVLTMRFEGLSVARVTVTAEPNARLRCRVFDPNGVTLQAARSGPRCHLQWLVPRTGAYRIEVENRAATPIAYRTFRAVHSRK